MTVVGFDPVLPAASFKVGREGGRGDVCNSADLSDSFCPSMRLWFHDFCSPSLLALLRKAIVIVRPFEGRD